MWRNITFSTRDRNFQRVQLRRTHTLYTCIQSFEGILYYIYNVYTVSAGFSGDAMYPGLEAEIVLGA